MKRPFFHILSSAAASLALLFAVPVLAQETIVYPGAPLQYVAGVPDSLAPSGSGSGKSNSLSGNSVTLNSGTVDNIHGAVNLNDTDPVINNRVFINGGTVGAVDGGHGVTTATGNSVTVSGGTVNWDIIGGHAMNRDDANKASVAENNSVTISGGRINRNVYGGYADNDASGSTATARNNTVTIRGTPIFGSEARLYGGFAYDIDGVGTITGNTLNFHSAGLSVRELDFFQNMNFYLPSTLNAGGVALTSTGVANLVGVTIKVGLEGAGPAMQTGDRFILITAGVLHGASQPTTGVIGGYAYTLAKEDNRLVLTIGAPLSGPTRDYTGQWHNPNEDNWGLSVLQNFPGQPRLIFVPWYTYDNNGRASWYVFQGDNWLANDTVSADVYRYTGPNWNTHGAYDNSRMTNAVVGTAKLTFTSETTAQFEYNVDGSSRTVDLVKLGW